MSEDISSFENHMPRVYGDDIVAWEARIQLQVDIEDGLRATNSGDVIAESMTPEGMYWYNRTISETADSTSDPQDYYNCGEVACLAFVELEHEFSKELLRLRNNTQEVEEI